MQYTTEHSLCADSIMKYADTPRFKIDCMKSVTSTNTLLKAYAEDGAEQFTVIAAEHQTAGRGRLNRDFYSPADTGVYFSILLRPDLKAERAMHLTAFSAVAVALALDEFCAGKAKIKWVNDIYIDGRKVCGILTEAAVKSGTDLLNYAVIGIGINVLPPKHGFPDGISNKAGAVVADSEPDLRNRVIGRVLHYFDKVLFELSEDDVFSEYCSRSLIDGMRVDVTDINSVYSATVRGIARDWRLIVELDGGEINYLSSGEVSVKMI